MEKQNSPAIARELRCSCGRIRTADLTIMSRALNPLLLDSEKKQPAYFRMIATI